MAGTELKDRIAEDVKAAMRARDKDTLSALRLIQADIKRIEVDERVDVDDARLLAVLDKMSKQRRDSLEQFRDAGRDDLADREAFELEVIQRYMPQPLSEAELDQLIDAAITEESASSPREMGAVMARLKPQVQGRADMGQVSQRVKARLS